MNQTLLIFAKNAVYGEVKTRLAETAGNNTALSVYKQLLAHTASITNYLPVEKHVFYSKAIEVMDVWDDTIYKKHVQLGDQLGSRMQNAFDFAFENGNTRAVIIGTDCLELTSAIIMNAFAWLHNHDVVIGPAKDGGYYLLGMKANNPHIFKDISWSTGKVMEQTLNVCDQLGLSVHLLPLLADIDDENDLNDTQIKLLYTKQ